MTQSVVSAATRGRDQVDLRPPASEDPRNRVLFVCSGNTCRSPMAAGLLRHLAESDPRFLASAVEVRSAGTSARSGDGATPLAVLVMKRRGIDLTGHRSTRLSSEVIRHSDVILTMTGDHPKEVLRLDPSARDRTFRLAEFAGGAGDVDDPMLKGTEAAYERCAEQLSRLIPHVLERLARAQGGP